MKVVICEKQIAARRIAGILSNGKFKTKREGKVPYYTFVQDGEEWIVVGLKGHILDLDYPEELNRWRNTSLKKLVWAEPNRKVINRAISKLLERLAEKNPDVVIATDFDREGELIGLETVELMKKKGKLKSVKRARFSAITRRDVLDAFSNLTELDHNLARSAEARRVIDLMWGATLTRFISLAAERYGKDFLSIGRVQSPTLAILVEREKEIRKFVPKPYWIIIARLQKGKKKFVATHAEEKFFDESKATDVFEKSRNAIEAEVKSVEEKIEKRIPPHPFDTTSFLSSATSILKIPAPKAMEIAEYLYMHGWISYPRTDNTVYPKNLQIREILEMLISSPLSEKALIAKDNLRNYPVRGKKETTDHPPIHPVGVPDFEKLTQEQRGVYELIASRFLATLMKDAILKSKEIEIEINGEIFVARGKEILEPAWLKVYPSREKFSEIPEMEEGDRLRIISIEKIRRETEPPKRLSQGSLIHEMERLGLGTKSTRHEIIKKLYDRKYIVGKYPVPTGSAFAVIDAIKNYDISKPDMTSQLEKEMDMIAEGRKNWEEVVRKSREMLDKVLDSLMRDKERIGSSIREAIERQNVVGKCPSCGGDMVIRISKNGKRFLGCSRYPSCKLTYPLPQKGVIIATDKKCKKCGAPIIMVGRREICPNCG